VHSSCDRNWPSVHWIYISVDAPRQQRQEVSSESSSVSPAVWDCLDFFFLLLWISLEICGTLLFLISPAQLFPLLLRTFCRTGCQSIFDRGISQCYFVLIYILARGGLLWMRQWTFRFHKTRGICCLADDWLASQEGLCSMEEVINILVLFAYGLGSFRTSAVVAGCVATFEVDDDRSGESSKSQ
jgi:hypothetical protein